MGVDEFGLPKVDADGDIALSLYQRAKGYSHPAVKIFAPTGDSVTPLVVPYTEHYPPDTAAAKHWLHNRQRGKWREAQSEDAQHMHVSFTIEGLPAQERPMVDITYGDRKMVEGPEGD